MAFAKHAEEEWTDLLRPSPRHSEDVLAASHRLWTDLYETACIKSQFPSSCTDVQNLLHQTPSIPDHPELLEIEEHGHLQLEGGSGWIINGTDICDLEPRTKNLIDHRVAIGTTTPSHCSFTGLYIQEWSGIESEYGQGKSSSNLLGVLVLGWTYVLSVLTVELRGTPECVVEYTDSTALTTTNVDAQSPDSATFDLPVGNMDDAEFRWWAAILAPNCGWRAVLKRRNSSYYPPWAVRLDETPSFRIRRNPPSAPSERLPSLPPSSEEAFYYLWNFSIRNHIQDQFLASFAAALTLPAHNRFGAAVKIPHPDISPCCCPSIPSSCSPPLQFEHLPSYMALSCMPRAIMSALCGSFWEPGIECNVVSEWLHPVTDTFLSLKREGNHWDTVVKMMAMRRPALGSLWLGSAITGLLPKVFALVESLPPTSIEATIWTRSPQSFMDPPTRFDPSSLTVDDMGHWKIRRQDELRLLFLTKTDTTVLRPPLSPWPPVGSLALQNAAFEAQTHASCRHHLQYLHWVWRLRDGGSLVDAGNTVQPAKRTFEISSSSLHKAKKVGVVNCAVSESASRAATQNVFSWALFEGRRVDERPLWSHEWLAGVGDSDESEDNGSTTSSGVSV